METESLESVGGFVCLFPVFWPKFKIKFSFAVPSDILETEISGYSQTEKTWDAPYSHFLNRRTGFTFVVSLNSSLDKSTMFSIALCVQIFLLLAELSYNLQWKTTEWAFFIPESFGMKSFTAAKIPQVLWTILALRELEYLLTELFFLTFNPFNTLQKSLLD